MHSARDTTTPYHDMGKAHVVLAPRRHTWGVPASVCAVRVHGADAPQRNIRARVPSLLDAIDHGAATAATVAMIIGMKASLDRLPDALSAAAATVALLAAVVWLATYN